ncbi:MFS transporter [Streptomyces zagrosensis]|uniref:FSR family fosmidomycin resistance protein-like MFS transporter n=1 Tax=Streptomyces zagrosensis TaxID=1042984 RepID=A0A7W9V1X7_9ACTN|nr:MFS transporter [Streptomyces zagrosensis]MBB5939660.1 FSR family fosmidomycin resistance protein-like MFS transporter [Streptomyces zagrosensis]
MTPLLRAGRRPSAIGLLAAAHACNDIYQGAVLALVPFWVSERHYGYVGVSGIVLAATLLSSVVQPAFGALTDRKPMPWLIPGGIAAAGLGIAVCGLVESYTLTWIAVAVSGLGVAAYHPEAARMARAVTGGNHVGMSWFSLGGNVGWALAPLFVTPVLAFGGLSATPLLIIPAALGVTLLMLTRSSVGGLGAGGTKERAGEDDWPLFLRLSAIVICRSIVYVGLSAFISLYVRQHLDAGDTAGAVALFILFGGGAVGTLLGGRLAARWGRVRSLRLAYAVAIPSVAGIPFAPGPLVYGCIALTSVALYVPFSLHVTLGQDYLPRRVGTASGVTLGLAVSIGGIASPLIGALAEATSLRWALAALVAMPIACWALSYTLTEPAAMEGKRVEPKARVAE